MRGLALALVLAAVAAMPDAAAQTVPRASAFDYIKAADIAFGRIERSAVYDEVTFESEPLREAKICDLNRDRIERLIETLKRAQALEETRYGLGADMVIRFRRAGMSDLVAVIARADEEGGKARIFFDGRLALLEEADLAQVHDVAADAGCGYRETGE